MNILYHHRTRGRGAEGVHITGVFEAFKSLNHDVTLLSFPGSDPDITKSVSPSLKKKEEKKSLFAKMAELTKKMPQFVFELFEIGYNALAFYRIHKANKLNNIEFIYERYSLFTFAGLFYAKLTKKPFILEINDSAIVERVRPLKLNWIAKKIEKYVFENATGLVFISSEFQRVATNEYKNIASSIVSPNAANIAHFQHDLITIEDAKEKLGIDKNKVVVGYTGAFVHWHGIDWFVTEMVEKLVHNPDLVLLLIGDGVAYESIEDLVDRHNLSDQIILTGRLAHTEIASYMCAMDFGILPDSNSYGSPMKLFEFMAMNKAMIVPNYPPIDEVIDDCQTGWLFPMGNKQACVNRVLSLYKDKDELARVGDNARQYILNERQWTNNAQDLLDLADKELGYTLNISSKKGK
jgi:glycosyltransferase involved in cell wall biosynthesis